MPTDRDRARLTRLRALVEPKRTAVITMELQRGTMGDQVLLPALRDVALAGGMLAATVRVCDAARDSGSRVVHCTVAQRNDGAGFAVNCAIFALSEKQRAADGHYATEEGRPGAEVLPELGPDPRDVVMPRMHGMSPFTSTSLDQVLRNLGVTTVVATGASVNLGVFGLTISAVDLGYQVILVRDAIAGVPKEYADMVIDNSLSLLSTVVSSDELLAAWTWWAGQAAS